MSKSTCVACDAKLSVDARFCAQCGAASQRSCPGCGGTVEPTARFCSGCGSSLDEHQSAVPPAPTPRSAGSEANQPGTQPEVNAERRHLTVVFCDLEASTELAQRIDEEELRKLVQGYYELCERIIKRYDGHIAEFIGDGVLIYFGYPTAHEDDAERAVRASLDIINDLENLRYSNDDISGASLSARIGIHTGPVIVGDLGTGTLRTGKALGETVNLAARLQGITESKTVVISDRTHQLVRGIFVEQDLGVQTLKGYDEPIRAYRVVQGSGVRGKLESTTRHLSKFVGHDLEIGLLLDRWEKTEYGEGQVVMITGEAGMGKSRLAVALRERLGETPHTWLDCACSQYTKNTAFHPVFEVIRQGLTITEDDTPEAKLGLLAGALERTGMHDPQAVPLLASFLDIPLDDTYTPLELSPDVQRRRTLDMLATWLIGLGQIQPLVIVFEDLHWCDPSSLDLLTAIMERNQTSRVLMVLTTRPNFESLWGDRSHLTPIKVSNLNKRHAREIALGMSPACVLPEEALEMVVERSNGIPLYVEELTQMVLESGILQEENGHYLLTGSLADLSIPATLQDSLMARLDSMAEAKGIAQMAAVLGREFTYIMLAEISQKAEKELEENLTTLVKAELLFQHGTSPDSSYTFKHALIQDAAYNSMLKSVRQQLHERAANSLEKRLAVDSDSGPEVLARHLEAAGNIERAAKIYQQAGEQAQLRSAYKEESSHCEKALALIDLLPEGQQRDQWELELQITAGHARTVLLGYEHELTLATHQKAHELAERVGNATQKVLAFAGLANALATGTDPRRGKRLAEQALKIAKQKKDVALQRVAYREFVAASWFLGEYQEQSKHALELIALYAKSPLEQIVSSPGGHPAVSGHFYAGVAHHSLGRAECAIEQLDRSKTLARQIEDPVSICLSLMYQSGVNLEYGYLGNARKDALEGIAIGEKNGIVTLTTLFRMFLIAVDDSLGNVSDPVSAIMAGLSGLSQGAPKSSTGILISILVKPLIKAGAFDQAKNILDLALSTYEATSHGAWKSEVLRLRGEVALQSPEEGEPSAESYFTKALELSRKREAKFWELRTTLSVARLRISQGRDKEGIALVRPVYEWFTEGFDISDMLEAKAMLDKFDANDSAQLN